MVGIRSEKRRWLRAVTARPKLSISFALLIFLVLFGGAKISAQSPRATAVIEIRENPLYEQIAALDSDLVPGPIVIGHEAERLRSVGMVLAVLSRLPEEEFNEIAAGNGTPPPTWLVDRLVTLCSREDAIGAMARLLCAVRPAGDIHPSSTVATIREGLEITADTEQGQILISLAATDPERAAAIVNLFADIYVQHL